MRALLLAALILLPGCAFMQKQVDYAKLCAQDPVCLSEAKGDAQLVGMIAGAAYPPIAGAATAAALTLILWFKGKKKEEN